MSLAVGMITSNIRQDIAVQGTAAKHVLPGVEGASTLVGVASLVVDNFLDKQASVWCMQVHPVCVQKMCTVHVECVQII